MTTSIVAANVHPDEAAKLQSLIDALPADSDLTELLIHIASAVKDGLDVALVDLDAELSPNQAAEFLKVSRPHLLKLLDNGFIPFHRVGRDRRVRNRDLIEYLTRREAARRDMAYANAQHVSIEMEAAAERAGIDPALLAELT